MRQKAQEILDRIVDLVLADGARGYLKSQLKLFTQGEELPCSRWSVLNRLLTYAAGTVDARGIRQWREVGRYIKKGSHAFYIFTPIIRRQKKVIERGDGEESDEQLISGYRLCPVFRVEDTEGKELLYQKRMREFSLDALPLIEVARALGVTVEKQLLASAAGCFNPARKTILLSCSSPQVFLHELSHAVDSHLGNAGKADDKEAYALGEVVAELSSAFLASLYNVPCDIDNTRAYIKSWSGTTHVAFALSHAIERVLAIYTYITQFTSKKEVSVKEKKETVYMKEGGEILLPFKTRQIKDRSQSYNSKTERWVKRDSKTGRFVAVKADGKPWSRVVKEAIASCTVLDDGDLPPAA